MEQLYGLPRSNFPRDSFLTPTRSSFKWAYSCCGLRMWGWHGMVAGCCAMIWLVGLAGHLQCDVIVSIVIMSLTLSEKYGLSCGDVCMKVLCVLMLCTIIVSKFGEKYGFSYGEDICVVWSSTLGEVVDVLFSCDSCRVDSFLPAACTMCELQCEWIQDFVLQEHWVVWLCWQALSLPPLYCHHHHHQYWGDFQPLPFPFLCVPSCQILPQFCITRNVGGEKTPPLFNLQKKSFLENHHFLTSALSISS